MPVGNPILDNPEVIERLVRLSNNSGLSTVQVIIFVVATISLVILLIGVFLHTQRRTMNALLSQQEKDAAARETREGHLQEENHELIQRVIALTEAGITASSATTHALAQVTVTLKEIGRDFFDHAGHMRSAMSDMTAALDQKIQAAADRIDRAESALVSLRHDVLVLHNHCQQKSGFDTQTHFSSTREIKV